jgi:hypothetical protein
MAIRKLIISFNYINPRHAVVSLMNYRDFEIQLSGESPNHFSAKVIEKRNGIAAQTFELRTSELKVIEGLQRLGTLSACCTVLGESIELYVTFFQEEIFVTL